MDATAKEYLGTVSPESLLSSREMLTKRLYTVPEVMRLARLTRKQVTYWSDLGLIRANFHNETASVGQPASFFTATEVLKVMIVSELRRAGIRPRQVQRIICNLQDHGIELTDAETYILTDGYSVYYAYSQTEVVDVHKHHRQMLLLVPIHEQVARLEQAA